MLAGGRIVSGLGATSLLLFGTVLALPLLSLPAILGGTSVDRGLTQAALLGAGLFLLMLAGGATSFLWDRPLRFAGGAVERILNRTVRRRRPVRGVSDRLLKERDSVRRTFGRRWKAAVLASTGRAVLDYLALLACLRAVGAEPNPSLVPLT